MPSSVTTCSEQEFPDPDTRTPQIELPIIDCELFGKLWAPRTLAEFSVVAQSASLLPEGTVGGWRGQSGIGWPLQPSALRRLLAKSSAWLLHTQPSREIALQSYEERLLELARLGGYGFSEGRELSDLELMGVLQHHGAATRLTDFSENAFTALWFAASAQPNEYGIVFGVSLDDVRRIDRNDLLKSSIKKLRDEADQQMTFWKPSALSPRMSAQSAFLLWSEVQNNGWSDLGTLAASIPDDERAISQLSREFVGVAVSPELKSYMHGRWKDTLGYSQAAMYPDLDGFANAHGHATDLPWDIFA